MNEPSCSLYGQNLTWTKLLAQINSKVHGSHIFITGPSGSGKTTIVRDFLKYYARTHEYDNWNTWGLESNDDCLLLTPDQDRGIQTIRNNVSLFIRQIGSHHLNSKKHHRWLIIDDCDLFPQISQQALRRPMETYSHITRFIFIGSSVEDLIPALQSRCIHIPMQPINFFEHIPAIIRNIEMPYHESFDMEMYYTIINICSNNFADFIRYLKLIKNYCKTNNVKPSLSVIQKLCSITYYNLFFPLVKSICSFEIAETCKLLMKIWKLGYTFEDILDNFQQIYNLYGNISTTNKLVDNLVVKAFLLNAWVDFCKGNASVLAIQNVAVRTIFEVRETAKKITHGLLINT